MSLVYFVSPENGGPIRIGCSSNPVGDRIRSMNALMPERLAILGTITGYRVREAMLLLRFRRQRVRGDWFRPSLDLWKLIGEAADTGNLADLPPEPDQRPDLDQSVRALADLGFSIGEVTNLLGLRAKPGRQPGSWGCANGSPAELQALHLGLASGWLSVARDFTPSAEAAA